MLKNGDTERGNKMARKIKRFLVFMFFSFFFAMFSKKIQTPNSSTNGNMVASAKGKSSLLQRLSPIGVNSAEALSCELNPQTCDWYCN